MSQRFPNANYPVAYAEANMGKADTLAVNAGRLEIQSVSNDGTGGTFTLTFRGAETAVIAYNANAAAVKAALELLATITTVNVTGIGTIADPSVVEFVTPDLNVPLMVGDGALITGETVGLAIVAVQDGSALIVTEATGAPL
jgi:hypothetical protein